MGVNCLSSGGIHFELPSQVPHLAFGTVWNGVNAPRQSSLKHSFYYFILQNLANSKGFSEPNIYLLIYNAVWLGDLHPSHMVMDWDLPLTCKIIHHTIVYYAAPHQTWIPDPLPAPLRLAPASQCLPCSEGPKTELIHSVASPVLSTGGWPQHSFSPPELPAFSSIFPLVPAKAPSSSRLVFPIGLSYNTWGQLLLCL